MKIKKGTTLLELIVSVLLIGIIMGAFIPLLVNLLSFNTFTELQLNATETFAKIADRLRQDVRASERAFVRPNGQGVLLHIPNGKGTRYVAYNVSEQEPETLYRSEFIGNEKCDGVRMSSRLRSFKVALGRDFPQTVKVEMVLLGPDHLSSLLTCRIVSSLRTSETEAEGGPR